MIDSVNRKVPKTRLPDDNQWRLTSERINAIGQLTDARHYLQVGVFQGETFREVNCTHRCGVDPDPLFDVTAVCNAQTEFHVCTSDAFFTKSAGQKFDIIFLDGLHTFEQTFRDFVNSLSHAHARTVWVIDDTWPSDLASALPSLEQVGKHRVLTDDHAVHWHGDVYKLIFAMHDFFPMFDWRTVIDRGTPQTVLVRSPREKFQPRWNSLAAISAMGYADFVQNFELLNPSTDIETLEWLKAELELSCTDSMTVPHNVPEHNKSQRNDTMTPLNSTIQPRIDFDIRLSESRNLFADVFGDLTAEEWLDTLIESIETRTVEGVEFPSFPPEELQSQIHGHSAAHSLREAASFYDFVRSQGLTGPDAPWFGDGYMLDYGAGWGRILRPFLRDFPLQNIIGYEPNGIFCSIARSHNPFVSFVSGGYNPPTIFADKQFNLIVGWSIFSHLSETLAVEWLSEFSRLLAPGGAIVMTTWGMRFLERLRREEAMLKAGEDIHWYSKVCLTGSGDLPERIRAYKKGEFVWFNTSNSALYGEAFLSEAALIRMINKNSLPLTLEAFDSTALAQDVFVLRQQLS